MFFVSHGNDGNDHINHIRRLFCTACEQLHDASLQALRAIGAFVYTLRQSSDDAVERSQWKGLGYGSMQQHRQAL